VEVGVWPALFVQYQFHLVAFLVCLWDTKSLCGLVEKFCLG
jgi:hypothetical protein